MYGATQTLSTLLMRYTAIQQCVLNQNKDPAMGLGYIKNCEQIYSSLSDTVAKNVTAVLRIQGLAFDDNICLVIANNNPSSTAVRVQFFQWYDSARYYGTVFSVILTVVGLAALTAHMSYHIYLTIVTSPDRINELKQLEAELSGTSPIFESPASEDASYKKASPWSKFISGFKLNKVWASKQEVGVTEVGRQ